MRTRSSVCLWKIVSGLRDQTSRIATNFNSLVHWVVCVLTLEGVHHGTDRDVDDEDEDFSTNEALVEIHSESIVSVGSIP